MGYCSNLVRDRFLVPICWGHFWTFFRARFWAQFRDVVFYLLVRLGVSSRDWETRRGALRRSHLSLLGLALKAAPEIGPRNMSKMWPGIHYHTCDLILLFSSLLLHPEGARSVHEKVLSSSSLHIHGACHALNVLEVSCRGPIRRLAANSSHLPCPDGV